MTNKTTAYDHVTACLGEPGQLDTYDPSMSDNELRELKRFRATCRRLGIDYAPSGLRDYMSIMPHDNWVNLATGREDNQ